MNQTVAARADAAGGGDDSAHGVSDEEEHGDIDERHLLTERTQGRIERAHVGDRE